MTTEHRQLFLLGESIRPADPEVSDCWQIFLRALMVGYLADPDEIKELQDFIVNPGPYSDIGIEEIMFEKRDGRLRVSLLDDAAECDATEFSNALAELEKQSRQQ